MIFLKGIEVKKYLILALALLSTPAFAQWQVPNNNIPIGRGPGYTGFSFLAPGANGTVLTSNGTTLSFVAPTTAGFVTGPASSITGRIPMWGDTTGKLLADSTYSFPISSIVGTTDTMTLTNKTLTSPVINTPTGIVKGDVGLGNVDNTSDVNKPVSTAQGALNATYVVGPGSAVSARIATFNGTTGKIIQDGGLGLPTSAIVGTTDTQTLTNKTLVGPASFTPPQVRITLTSGAPVMQASVPGATAVYVTPAAGGIVPLYDGTTNFTPTTFAEVNQLTTDTTKSPAAVAASSVYDVFCWSDAGTNRCTRGPAWTNPTTRGYTLTYVNGIALNTSLITNGPAALRGTWVGIIASNASSTIDYILGGSASGGTPARLMVWNAYNQTQVGPLVTDNAAFTSSSATVQIFHNGGTMTITYVSGNANAPIMYAYATEFSILGVAGAFGILGVGFDNATAFTQTRTRVGNPTTTAFQIGAAQSGVLPSGLGVHTLNLLQQSDSSNLNQFNNTATANISAILWN